MFAAGGRQTRHWRSSTRVRAGVRPVFCAALHDFLYIAWQYLEDEADRVPRRQDRRFADAMYRAAMTGARVPAARVALIHAAVRVFGWPAYRAANAGTFAESA